MKKLLSLFLVLVMCFSFVSCGSDSETSDTSNTSTTSDASAEISTDASAETSTDASAETSTDASETVSEETEETASTPLLYKVTDNKGNIAWLFGSLHIGLKEYYPLPDYVMDAFNSSDALAVEFDILEFREDQNAVMECLALMTYKDGSKISDHISEEIYTEAKKILEENNAYSSALDNYMPCYWEALVTEVSYGKYGIVAENGVDEHLLNAAKEKSMEIIDIETPKSQYSVNAGFSEELQEVLLADAISVYETGVGMDETKELINIWMFGNQEEIAEKLEINITDKPEETKGLYEEYKNAVLTERDKNMTEFAISSLESGKEIFICVGAAHVICDNGMIDQLIQKGYTVEKVSA